MTGKTQEGCCECAHSSHAHHHHHPRDDIDHGYVRGLAIPRSPHVLVWPSPCSLTDVSLLSLPRRWTGQVHENDPIQTVLVCAAALPKMMVSYLLRTSSMGPIGLF